MANYLNFAIFAKINLGGNLLKVWKVPSIINEEDHTLIAYFKFICNNGNLFHNLNVNLTQNDINGFIKVLFQFMNCKFFQFCYS